MNWMNDMKVAYKLVILNIVALIGMFAIGAAGYLSLQTAKEAIARMYEVNLTNIDLAGKARHAMRMAQLQSLLAPLNADPTLYQLRATRFNESVKELDQCIADYIAINKDTPELIQQLNLIQKDWDKAKQVGGNLVAMKPPQNADGATFTAHRNQALDYYDKEAMNLMLGLGDKLVDLQQLSHQISSREIEESTEDIDGTTRNMLIGLAVAALVLIGTSIMITRAVTSPLDEVIHVCNTLRDGDFREKARTLDQRGDEFGMVIDAVVELRTIVNGIMKKTSVSAEQLAASSQELTASAHQSAQASEQVAQSVTNSASATVEQQQNVGDAMESIDHALGSIVTLKKTAALVADHANTTNEQAAAGSKAIELAVEKILSVERIVNNSAGTVDKLGQRSKEIGQIVEAISGIADQTNLLALNAAIEAARAGEHGRGFAVVSDEVRKLAEESLGAAQKIATLIKDIQNDTDDAVQSMHEGSIAVREGTQSVEQLRTNFDNIGVASQNMADASQNMVRELDVVSNDTDNIKTRSMKISDASAKVSTEMESVSAASQQQSASAEEIASASDALANLAQDLQTSLQRFQY
ncbi:MAG: methyl-accepting chemotaxis protein [Selenomonadaceae bacterium]|nr:methyl-accepting chemotaxis protein [Selenomonadaceae bacterium]